MIFPELRRIAKRLLPDSSEPIALNLKSAFNFDAVSAGWYFQNGYPQIGSILAGGLPSWSGETVNIETSLNHSVIWACNRLICEEIGLLPPILMQRTASGKRVASEHPMYSAMINAPNTGISAQCFTEMLTGHCLLQGNGFAKITRRSGTGVAIRLDALLPQQVFPDQEKSGQRRLVYVIKESGIPDKTYTVDEDKPQDILHLRGLGWNGIRGYSVIELGRQSIGTAIAADRHLGKFWANGGRLPQVIEWDKKFATDEDFKAWRAQWEQVYGEPWKTPVTEPGMTIKQTGGTMRDSQGIENRQFTVSELCRWFGVSPSLVAELANTNNSISENLTLNFLKMTLSPWVSRWEGDFWRCVLTPDEKSAGYYLRHNVRELLRADFKTRMESYASALQNGHMNVDEVRDEEDKDPLPNGAGKTYHYQLNMQTTPGTGQPGVVEQGILNRTTGATTPGTGAAKAFDNWLEQQLADVKREEGVLA